MGTATTFGEVDNGRGGDGSSSTFHVVMLGNVGGQANCGEFGIGDMTRPHGWRHFGVRRGR